MGADLRLSALEARIREYARLRASTQAIASTGLFPASVTREDLVVLDKKLAVAAAAVAELRACVGR